MRMIVSFKKTEQVRHLGHLDLMRSMQRALRRSGLPVKYSQGFNPHIVLSFASPLSVGMSGAEELMDVALETSVEVGAFEKALQDALPPSLPLVAVRPVDDKHPALMAQLRTAAYDALLAPSKEAEAIAESIAPLLKKTEIIAIRKTKRGETPCDIRPMIHELTARQENGQCLLRFQTSLTERATLKPDLLLRTLAGEAGVALPYAGIRRTRLYGERDGQAIPLMEI